MPGMGWHNMSEWHIDHIMPLASFNFTGLDDPAVREAWALSNLRPLWAADNIRKGARLPDGQAPRANGPVSARLREHGKSLHHLIA